jgi:hypothetical protein
MILDFRLALTVRGTGLVPDFSLNQDSQSTWKRIEQMDPIYRLEG